MRVGARFAWVAVVLGALLAPLAAAPASAAPVTIFVGPSRTIKTIQGGIDAAANGDTVSVDAKSGDYVENAFINGKYITLTTTSGPVTMRSASAGNAVLQILNAPSNPTFRNDISGFTFTGGVSNGGQGGGVTIYNASPELRNCIIDGNRANAGYGGGILVYLNSNPFIHDNIVRNNTARDGGAGIFINNNSAPVIVKNQITNNNALGPWTGDPNGGSSGAGIYMLNQASNPSAYVQPVILGNTISNNTANFAGGGMIIGTGINAIVEDNTIDSNTAAYGGGIHIESVTSQPVIDSNRITNNVATAADHASAGQGGGIAVFNQSRPTISNNTITGNQATKGGGGITAAENSTSTISGNVISSNVTGATVPNGDGGGLYVAYAVVTLTNNVLSQNTADNGGAIGLATNATIDIVHNTIVKNVERDDISGAIYVGDSVTRTAIVNNVMYANSAFQVFEPSARARIDNNVLGITTATSPDRIGMYFSYLTHNLDTATSLNNSTAVNAAANVVADPRFTSLAQSDFSLLSNSPAIGVATTSNVPSVAIDIRRVQRATMPPDAGAYEYEANPTLASAPVLSGAAEVSKSLLVTSGTWGPAPGTVSYQWYVDRVAVPGETGPTYAPRLDDVGKQVNVVVTSTKYGVYSKSFTSNITSPVLRGSYFADVPTTQTFYTNIMWMYDSGISTGSANAPYAPLYKPTDSVSRQAMALFLYRLSGETFVPPADPTFADVTPENSPQFFTAIEWMFASGISTGTAQPTGKPMYKPADAVSREVMGIFLARFSKVDVSVPPTQQSFADVPINSTYAAALQWMKDSGISTGTVQPTGLPLYKPQDPVSRQAMAAFLFRLSHLP